MHFLCFQAVFELMSDSLTAIQVVPNQCPSHQSILLTQGPIHEILAVIAQLLGVVEKLSFFESAILKIFCNFFFSFFFASFLSKLVNIYGIARIFQNFDDYPSFHKISGVSILLQHSVNHYVEMQFFSLKMRGTKRSCPQGLLSIVS